MSPMGQSILMPSSWIINHQVPFLHENMYGMGLQIIDKNYCSYWLFGGSSIHKGLQAGTTPIDFLFNMQALIWFGMLRFQYDSFFFFLHFTFIIPKIGVDILFLFKALFWYSIMVVNWKMHSL